MTTRKFKALPLLILFVLLVSACQSNWTITLTENGAATGSITREDVDFYNETLQEEYEEVLVDQFLYDTGYRLIDQIVVSSDEDEPLTFSWGEIAENAFITGSGELLVDDVSYPVTSIEVQPSERLADIELSIMDISPTILNALGMPALPDAEGENLFDYEAQRAVIILTDGTQYDKLNEMLAEGDLPFFASQEKIYCGMTVYPPVTVSSSAALFTAAPPAINKVYGHGYRTTETITLFDIIVENGGTAMAVEGDSLPFNLRNAEITLSGDKDGNGYSDDNVFSNAMNVIENGMPTMLYIHFHEIDDMGHSYGENSSEYEEALIRVDQYIAQLVEAFPADTLIITIADHGMHTTSDGGNHGTLSATDMLIPITIILK